MKSPLIDMTSLLAIESCFRTEAYDPWRFELAGKLADFFVYSDTIRYTFPSPNDPSQSNQPWQAPPLVDELKSWDSKFLYPEGYSTARHREIASDVLERFFYNFSSWALANQRTLTRWLGLHNQSWLRSLHNSHVPHKYVYALNVLRRNPKLRTLAAELKIDEDDICYGVDIMLKYPFFGELAKGDYYLNHPIRGAVAFPTLKEDKSALEPPPVCVTFAEDVKRTVKNLSRRKRKSEALREYVALLYDLRRICREDFKLHNLSPKQVDKEVLREIAMKVKLSPKLKGEVNEFGALVGTVVKPAKFVISIMNRIWKDGLPRSSVQWSSLQFIYTWDVERQAQVRE